MQVKDEGVSWNIEGSKQGDLIIEDNGRDVPLHLRDAKQFNIEPYETGFMSGIKIRLKDSGSTASTPARFNKVIKVLSGGIKENAMNANSAHLQAVLDL